MEEMCDKQRRKIVEEIDSYLMEMENNEDGDARVLHLLSAAREALKEEKEGGKEEREGINIIQSALKNIQHRLIRIKEQGPRN